MKILLLSDSNSPHTLRWAKSIRSLGFEVCIFSLHKPDANLYKDSPEIKLYSINATRDLQSKSETSVSKLIYLKAVGEIKNILRAFKPNIVHAHYASSYGLVGALVGFNPYIISMWGGDVFGFPKYSFLHRALLTFSLSRADKLFSTSRVMKYEAQKYTKKNIGVIPFGIDIEKFKPFSVKSIFSDNDIVIGTIKTLEVRYGIKYLITAFAIVKNKFPNKSLKLLIAGQGTQSESLKNYAHELGISNETIFTGYIQHDEVQNYHNMIDIYVAVSLEESFGVAILEASACGKPVIVSNVGGLPEVVEDGKTGFIIESKNSNALVNALNKLILDVNLRIEMGKKGRDKVINEYEWDFCLNQMVFEYKSLVH